MDQELVYKLKRYSKRNPESKCYCVTNCRLWPGFGDTNLTLGTWDNLSLRIDDTYMLITPSGMAYERNSL